MTAKPDGSGSEGGVHCIYCFERVSVAPGGRVYRYTQILLHLDRCVAEATEHERQQAARQMAGDE